ncbi:Hypothetical predicted protein [Podarcis lilfordi]|uniref:Uncharacterized protein n=1 Tax=Podarcis lilfordi TaxID=74358 RepID=A0AA35KN72_9SAUR|nr:Hypothetical predicted protein [Podarcis lilfordi]
MGSPALPGELAARCPPAPRICSPSLQLPEPRAGGVPLAAAAATATRGARGLLPTRRRRGLRARLPALLAGAAWSAAPPARRSLSPLRAPCPPPPPPLSSRPVPLQIFYMLLSSMNLLRSAAPAFLLPIHAPFAFHNPLHHLEAALSFNGMTGFMF